MTLPRSSVTTPLDEPVAPSVAPSVHEPRTITIAMPVTAWRVLGLGQRRRVSSARRVWRAEMHGPNTVRVTMDTQCAVELRQSAGVASQDRHGLTARQRQAAWKIIPRITAALDSLGRGYTAR